VSIMEHKEAAKEECRCVRISIIVIETLPEAPDNMMHKNFSTDLPAFFWEVFVIVIAFGMAVLTAVGASFRHRGSGSAFTKKEK